VSHPRGAPQFRYLCLRSGQASRSRSVTAPDPLSGSPLCSAAARLGPAAVGLAIGGGFGLAGAFVGRAELCQELWAIDGVALVVATALLTVKFLRQGNDCVAAGFLVFVAGESLLLSGNAAGLQGSLPSYAGGIALWSASRVMTSVAPTFGVRLKTERNIGFSVTVSPRALKVAGTSLGIFFYQLGTRPQRIGTSSRAPSRTRTASMVVVGATL
jgi:hypothetical protein